MKPGKKIFFSIALNRDLGLNCKSTLISRRKEECTNFCSFSQYGHLVARPVAHGPTPQACPTHTPTPESGFPHAALGHHLGFHTAGVRGSSGRLGGPCLLYRQFQEDGHVPVAGVTPHVNGIPRLALVGRLARKSGGAGRASCLPEAPTLQGQACVPPPGTCPSPGIPGPQLPPPLPLPPSKPPLPGPSPPVHWDTTPGPVTCPLADVEALGFSACHQLPGEAESRGHCGVRRAVVGRVRASGFTLGTTVRSTTLPGEIIILRPCAVREGSLMCPRVLGQWELNSRGDASPSTAQNLPDKSADTSVRAGRGRRMVPLLPCSVVLPRGPHLSCPHPRVCPRLGP